MPRSPQSQGSSPEDVNYMDISLFCAVAPHFGPLGVLKPNLVNNDFMNIWAFSAEKRMTHALALKCNHGNE